MHGNPIASRTGRAPQGVLRVDLAGCRPLDMRAEIEQLGIVDLRWMPAC
jgi:hypothetical protein